MEYNFLKKEVYISRKHFIKKRIIKLGKCENIFFATMWFSKEHKAPYKELYKRVYGYNVLDKSLLRNMARILRDKGIELVCISNYGYKLKKTY